MKEIYCKVNEAPKKTNTDIITFLKRHNARLSFEDNWLVWADAWCLWQVYQQKYNRQVKRIYQGNSLDEALQFLESF